MSTIRVGRAAGILLAGLLCSVSLAGCGKSGDAGETVSASGYTEEQVKLRDITTYHSFTGTIAPVTERNVLPDLTGVKVTKVNVEKGDEVKAGDVLMVLDADSLNEQIAELEASINAASASADASIQSAQTAYSNYQKSLNDGLDQSIQSAKSQMDTAEAQLVSAQQAYNNEVNLNNQGMSQTIMSAKQQVDSAYSQLQSAQGSQKAADVALKQAEDGVSQANDNLQKAKDSRAAAQSAAGAANTAEIPAADAAQNLAAANTAEIPAGDAAQNLVAAEQAVTTAEQAVTSAEQAAENAQVAADNAQTTVDSAQTAYDNAVQSYEAAKQGEENSLTSLYDQLISAQTAYTNAVDAYNAAVRGSKNQLDTYADQVNTAKAGSDQTANELKLADLKDQVSDCEVKAPIDGVVTALNVTEGDIAATAQPAAVITNFDKMKIDIKINEYDILGVEEGKPVTINIDALNKNYDGTIESIDRVATVENGVSYFESEVDFNGDEDARSGMSAEVRMVVNQSLNATSVHSDAIQTDDDGSTFVYEYSDDKHKNLKKVPVTTGVSDGTYTEVTEGVYPGDTVLYKPSTGSIEELREEMVGGDSDDGGAQGGNAAD